MSVEHAAIRLDPSRMALLLIEYQREWLDPDGKLNHLMQDRPQFAAARAAGLRIVHVGLCFAEGYPELGRADHGIRGAIPELGTFRGPAAAFVPPFDPRPGEFVVAGRTGASGFAGSNLASYLRHQEGLDTLLIAGFALHVCVESTFRQAHDLGYRPVLVADAAAAFTPEQRRHVLEAVVRHFGTEATLAQVLTALRPEAVAADGMALA
jgi:nicotinamidase-related amidase